MRNEVGDAVERRDRPADLVAMRHRAVHVAHGRDPQAGRPPSIGMLVGIRSPTTRLRVFP